MSGFSATMVLDRRWAAFFPFSGAALTLITGGVVKTHRLTLNDIESLLAPGISEEPNESRLTIGPKALKDLIDQFPSSKNAKSDPQLSWTFGDTRVQVKSHETSMETRGACRIHAVPTPALLSGLAHERRLRQARHYRQNCPSIRRSSTTTKSSSLLCPSRFIYASSA